MSEKYIDYIIIKKVELPEDEKFHGLSADDTYETIGTDDGVGIPMGKVSMTEEEKKVVEDLPQVFAVYEDTVKSLPEPVEIDDVEANSGVPYHRVSEVHNKGLKGQGALVAVLDTGLDQTHAGGEFRGRVVAGQSFVGGDWYDRHGHGTHVAGTIAGLNGIGMAPEARLLIGKVLADNGSGSTSGIIKALDWAVASGAHVINMSLGGGGDPSDPMSMTVDRIYQKGVLVVAAAGNDGCGSYTADVHSPGCAREAVSVAAVDLSSNIASFSSCGNTVDVAAFGVRVVSLGLNGVGNRAMSGTSMATPHVAGIAALFAPSKTAAVIRNGLLSTSRNTSLEAYREGRGIVDAMALYNSLVSAPAPAPTPTPAPGYLPGVKRVSFSHFCGNIGTLKGQHLVLQRFRKDAGEYKPKGM